MFRHCSVFLNTLSKCEECDSHTCHQAAGRRAAQGLQVGSGTAGIPSESERSEESGIAIVSERYPCYKSSDETNVAEYA